MTSRSVSGTASLHVVPSKRQESTPWKAKAAAEPSRDASSYSDFRRICDAILEELTWLADFLVDGQVSDEGGESTVEIEELLERLYALRYGSGEFLKRVVVALQSQIINAIWETRHVEYLTEAMRYLRLRYVVDEETVSRCYEMMKAYELDPLRGTIGSPRVARRYRIEAVKEDDGSTTTNS